MATDIGKYNLEKDKNVLGKNWLSTYGGWFSDEGNMQIFIDSLKPHLPNIPLDILYVASASGLLGERLLESLGCGNLTIVDISDKHLYENKNPKTIKVNSDLLEMDLGKEFDLIIMRSALDYFPTNEEQIKVLKIINRHLKPDGIFVNQPAYISNTKDRDLVSAAYNSGEKIGKRLFQASDMGLLYSEAGFTKPIKIGEGKIMEISEKDHIERYEINDAEIKDIQNILVGASANAQVTPTGYTLQFEFPIFISKKNGSNIYH